MFWVRRGLKIISREAIHQIRQLRDPFNLDLKTYRDRVSTTSLSNLFQYLIALWVKNFFLKFTLKPTLCQFNTIVPCPHVLLV